MSSLADPPPCDGGWTLPLDHLPDKPVTGGAIAHGGHPVVQADSPKPSGCLLSVLRGEMLFAPQVTPHLLLLQDLSERP